MASPLTSTKRDTPARPGRASTRRALSADEEQELRARVEAIGRSQAMIEFGLDGTILGANDNFLSAMGYTIGEVLGEHHRMFVTPEEARSPEYREFWARLNRGEFVAGEFHRVGKGGRDVWIQAAYNPILDASGKPTKVVKVAMDVTEEKQRTADYQGQIAAIHKSQAVIEFDLDGRIRTANDNFLQAMGYTLAEVKGKHHAMFVEPAYAANAEYREFWAKLNRGEYVAGEFKRVGKGGREVWIQASYNPILDLNGKPVKVVKYATDVTSQVLARRDVAETARKLSDASDELSAVSTQLATNAKETSSQATAAASGLVRVRANSQSIAAATEEMSSSIKEIAQNTQSAAKVAAEAVQSAAKTNQTVTQLGASSEEIGQVIKLISEIAAQTNLLALNATIEAARAGAAGRGFAVVANEVKELARETAKATDDIGRRIRTIQSDTSAAVEAIGHIGKIVKEINDFQSAIAAAVEEQSATTGEMTRHVAEAARDIVEIETSVKSVADAAQSTLAGAEGTQTSATSTAKMSDQLKELVARF